MLLDTRIQAGLRYCSLIRAVWMCVPSIPEERSFELGHNPLLNRTLKQSIRPMSVLHNHTAGQETHSACSGMGLPGQTGIEEAQRPI